MATEKKRKMRVRKNGSMLAPLSGRNSLDELGSASLFSRKEKIFRKGQSARHIYKVESGCVKTYTNFKDRRLLTAFYFPGDYFGLEMRAKHHVFAEAVATSMVKVIGIDAIKGLSAIDFSVARYLLHITNLELQRAQNHSLLLRSTADERLGHFLFEMKRLNRTKDVELMMSRQDIADHLNLMIETVSRAFTRLEKASAISFLSHRRVAVHVRRPLAV
jgi:CRP/FNR family nitrogen fixation transcriptional regulator